MGYLVVRIVPVEGGFTRFRAVMLLSASEAAMGGTPPRSSAGWIACRADQDRTGDGGDDDQPDSRWTDRRRAIGDLEIAGQDGES